MRAEVDGDAVGGTDPLRGRPCLGRNRLHGGLGQAAQVEHKAGVAGDLAGPVQGRVGKQLPAGEHQIRAGLFLLQPHALHVVQQCDGGGDRVMPVGAVNGSRVGIGARAVRVAEALAAADAADHGGGQAARHQCRALFDVQLEVGADAGRIQQAPSFPDRLRVKALPGERRLQRLAIVGSGD